MSEPNGRQKHDTARIEELLNQHLAGKTYRDISLESGVPMATLHDRAAKQRRAGTELGNKLQALRAHFPSGTSYAEGMNGRAKLVEDQEPVKTVLESEFVDEFLHEIALKLGQQQLELIKLRIKTRKG